MGAAIAQVFVMYNIVVLNYFSFNFLKIIVL